MQDHGTEVIIRGTSFCDLSVDIRVNPWLAIKNCLQGLLPLIGGPPWRFIRD